MPLSIATALVRNLIKVPAVVLRSHAAKDAAVLAGRHENAVPRRQIALWGSTSRSTCCDLHLSASPADRA